MSQPTAATHVHAQGKEGEGELYVFLYRIELLLGTCLQLSLATRLLTSHAQAAAGETSGSRR